MEEKREFKGIWIPKDIWVSVELSVTEKVFLAEIDSFEKAKGCFASNRYFGEFFGISKSRVSQIISELNDKGYINVSYNYTYGTKEIKERLIKLNWRKIHKNGDIGGG